ncbi:pyridoxal-phosphate dependent enzyme [Jeotgalibacillus salarius]|uniref:threonine ammonia-lyase n=1 Tax=Jeotgalibacillus salarius TaxID=546023 RepID=A0A4Y8LDW0_9BACL|nr:pyridoxal-phosphate dependent enzyme [Jeotgalibacillus salarius]
MNKMTGQQVWMKLENLQKTGSFKVRGAMNKISSLTEIECKRGIIAASAGNHAQGVALAGQKKGIEVTIFMPKTTPIAKVNATREYGAEVVLIGETFDDAYAAACQKQEETGAVFIHPFDDLKIIEGQATAAIEMLQQCPHLERVFVPAGGGGLLAGTALAVKALKPSVKVIGVQSAAAPAIAASFFGQSSSEVPFLPTIAEGIKVKSPGTLTTSIINKYVDDMVTVTEGEIAKAILFMLEREKMLVEGAGAAGIAALLSNTLSPYSGQTGVIVSGGNFDAAKLGRCIELAGEVKEPKRKLII